MKVSYNWLKDYCEFDLPAHELAERLGHVGLEVETYEPRGDDWMLDVEVKSNRPDCLSHLGIAREVAAVTGSAARRPELEPAQPADEPLTEAATVEVHDDDLCPHYTARLIRGVSVGRSPEWLRQRLLTCGLRPVNNIADITNYVMLESGQPLHAFDFSLLSGNTVLARRARAGETIVTIDGTELELDGDECVIADAAKPVALAGVMGGLESEIAETTEDVLIEAARFDPGSIRRTSRRHAVSSDSSYRFERGVDPEITDWASRRCCRLITEIAGGRPLSGSANIRSDQTLAPEVTLRYSRLALVLGIEVPSEEVASIFRSLELKVTDGSDKAITVRVPSWRGDLRREVDLIEEVARIHGYDKINETTEMPVRMVVPPTPHLARRRTREMLAGQGFNEAMTYSLVRPTDLQRNQPWHDGDPIGVRNPVSSEHTHLRLTHVANLLEVKRHNASRGTPEVDLFELGAVYLPLPDENLPEEKTCLALLTDREQGLRVLKGVLDNLLEELAVEADVEEEPGADGPFDPQASLLLSVGGQKLGCAGLICEGAAEEMDLETQPAVMELDFDRLADRARLERTYRPIPEFPSSRRDLAVVVDEGVLWAEIASCIRENAPEILESVEMFDVYRGDPVPGGRKSIAFALTYRRSERTITAEEADEATEAILEALRQELDAELR